MGRVVRGLLRLIAAAKDVGRPVGPTSSADAEARAAITGVITGAGGGPAPTRHLVERIQKVEACLTRSAPGHRETVNIGVVGSTKVGKSTLLRTITGLPDTVIPTTRFNPTTASASRIYHTTGQPSAVLTLHTWESFRDSYLAPLHQAGGLEPRRRGRRTSAATGIRPGSETAGAASSDDYLRRLAVAQSSFDSYEHLLTARGGPSRWGSRPAALRRLPGQAGGEPRTSGPTTRSGTCGSSSASRTIASTSSG